MTILWHTASFFNNNNCEDGKQNQYPHCRNCSKSLACSRANFYFHCMHKHISHVSKKIHNEYWWNLLVYYVRNEREKQQYLLKYKGYKRITCWWCDLTYGAKQQQQRNVCRLASVTLPKVFLFSFSCRKNYEISAVEKQNPSVSLFMRNYVSFRQFYK